MLLVGPFQAQTEGTTVLEMLHGQLDDTASGLVGEDIWRALAEEVWGDPLNDHLQGFDRTRKAGGTSAADNQLFADEWIYLPPAIGQPYIVERTKLPPGADAASTVMTDAKTKETKGLCIPGNAVTDDQLAEIAFNVAVRAPSSSSVAQTVFYCVVPIISTVVDAVPTTRGAVHANQVFATPFWLPALWHQIDRLHLALDVHLQALQQYLDIHGDVQVMVAILEKMDRYLTTYQKLEGSRVQNIGPFQAQCKELSESLAKSIGAARMPSAQYKAVVDAWDAVEKVLATPEFSDGVLALQMDRDRFPGTCHALDLLIAAYVVQGANTDSAADDIIKKATATVRDLAPQGDGVWKHACGTLSLIGAASTVAAGAMGNTPGPATLSIAFMKVVAFARIAAPDLEEAAKYTNKVILWLAKLQRMQAGTIVELAVIVKSETNKAALFRKKMEQWDIWKKMQKGRGLTGAIGLFDLLVLVNDAVGLYNDVKSGDKPWYTIAGDAVALTAAGAATAGVAATFLVKFMKTGKWQTVTNLFMDKGVSYAMGGAALVVCVFDIVAAANAEKGEEAREKLVEAAGNLLVGVEPFIPMVGTRLWAKAATSVGGFVARLVGRSAAQMALEGVAGVAATEVTGEAVLIVSAEAIAGALSFIGGAILIGLLIYQNRKAIREMFVANPGKLARTWLEGIEGSKTYALAPKSVKDVMEECQKAWSAASWARLDVDDDAVKAALKKAGLDDSDIENAGDGIAPGIPNQGA